MRVLVDANVLFSALIFPSSTPAAAVRTILDSHRLLVTAEILREVETAIAEKFPRSLPALRRLETHERLERPEQRTRGISPPPIRDPKDLHVLEAALQPGVDGLLTGDKDFQTPEIRERLAVWTPAEFVALFGDEADREGATGRE